MTTRWKIKSLYVSLSSARREHFDWNGIPCIEESDEEKLYRALDDGWGYLRRRVE